VDQLRSAESIISGSKELERVLLSPAVNKTRRAAVIGRLSDELGLHRLIRNFVLVVVSHRRTNQLREIRRHFEAVVPVYRSCGDRGLGHCQVGGRLVQVSPGKLVGGPRERDIRSLGDGTWREGS